MPSEKLLSIKELAEAALLSLEKIDTVKLAALGRDMDSVTVGDARRFLDRLLYEISLADGPRSDGPTPRRRWKGE